MQPWLRGAVLVGVLGLAGTLRAAEPDFQPGQWQSDMEITMEGLPMAIPPQKQTTTACHTREKAVPDTADKSSDCRMVEQKFEGNKVTWKVECSSKEGKTEGQGEITYAGTTYTGQFVTNMAMEGMKVRSVVKLKGKRLGDCPK